MMMTNNEARDILMHHNRWRRGAGIDMQHPQAIGIAIDTICEPPSIAQSIRDAAINWPQYLGDVECGIVESFYDRHYGQGACSILAALGHPSCPQYLQNKYRTFMLFVAEALE